MDLGAELTFFFSDIEGSTRAAAALGERFGDALEAHRRLVRSALAAGGGVEVSTAGDSFFAVFPDALGALTAATTIQQGAPSAEEPGSLRARIGLHTGRAMRIGEDYVGIDVHRAARISDAGHGGQILVSATTRDAIADGLPSSLTLVDLGRHRLKDVGPERLWQVAGEGLPAGPFPTPRSLEAHPTNLPADTTPFVGRERELRELRALVVQERLVTVTGPGGIGKTRLAIATAASLVADLADGVFHLDLAATLDAAAAVSALIEVLGLRIDADEAPLGGLLDRLRNRDVLIVLDTADRVQGLADLAAAIASACPRVHVLVTSRSPLRVRAEQEYALGPLDPAAAAQLYADRARSVRPGFALDDTTRPEVARLVKRLDGLPLAIELAAARARLLTPAALLDRLERRLPALGEAGRDAPDRQRTLQATIAWSCELLAPLDQLVFEQLGVLAGSVDLAAIEAIVDVGGAGDVAAIVETLVERSLVVAGDGPDGTPRFRLLGPVREFAVAALAARGAEPQIRERHARYWEGALRAAAAELERGTALDVVQRIGTDEPNILQAVEWLFEHEPRVGAELISLLGRYWRLRGRVAEGLQWLARAEAHASDAPPGARADLLFWLGALLDDAGRAAEAAGSMERALALRRELGDERGIARSLNSLGVISRSLGDLDRAGQLLEESIERAEALGDRRGIAMSLNNLAVIASDRGDHDGAVEMMERAQAIDEELGGAYVFVGSANMATILMRAGRTAEGLARIRQALPGIEQLDDPELVVEALATLGTAALDASPALAARLGLAADALAAQQRHTLQPTDRAMLDDVIGRASAALAPDDLAALRLEVQAIDVEAGLALAKNAAETLSVAGS